LTRKVITEIFGANMSDRLTLDEYKQQIADLYSDQSASYDHGAWHPRIAHRLIEYADIRPGQKILDLATGTGMVAISAAQIVGDEGYVMDSIRILY
jgi:ubiquinone/menaquinone biosynthesis C-methylase UbiE